MQGSILGPLFFLFYINDLQKIINNDVKMILFAVDTSILVTNPNKTDFNININQTFLDINIQFRDNLLSLNFNKTHYLQLKTKHYYNVNTQTKFDLKYITKAAATKFLGLIIDDTLSWKQHTDQVINKMHVACCVIRNIKSLESQDTLKIIYFAHIHSILSYAIILGGNSSYINKVFILKKIIRIITNTIRDSCRELFKDIQILLMYSQYIYSLIIYTINNKHLYNINNEIQKYRTRNNNNLHLPIVNLSKFNKGAYFLGIKAFNHLLRYIKNFTNDQKCFIPTLKRFLYQQAF